MLATKRRVSGATTKIVGKATIQLLYHAVAHNQANPSDRPAAFSVATPDTTQDIMIDKKKLNNSGANLAGTISYKPSFSSHCINSILPGITLARYAAPSASSFSRHHLNLSKPTDHRGPVADPTGHSPYRLAIYHFAQTTSYGAAHP